MAVLNKVEKALVRLTKVLPLAERQAECSESVRNLHRRILQGFVDEGRMLIREEMMQIVADFDAALAELREHDLVTFSACGEPVGAYPFTAETREHEVQVNGYRVHAMCALDALAISPMFDLPARISSRCRISGDVIEIQQSGQTIENSQAAGDVHVGIDWGAASGAACCANSLCLEMLYLRDDGIARQWLADAAETREVFSLPEAVDLASRFFVPLLR